MVKYPLLSKAQQQDLPKLIQAKSLPTMFGDSTHQIWHCDTMSGALILKVCDNNNVANSTFWQGMSLLFNVQLSEQLAEFNVVYDLLGQYSLLAIPDYIASDNANKNKEEPAFILTKMMSGNIIEPQKINDDMVISLANQISHLHRQQHIKWGKITQPNFPLNDWSVRLQNTLQVLAEKHDIPKTLLDEALAQAKAIAPDFAVPIMLDLRWDQFLQNTEKLTTLVDLDAFVLGDRKLELVLIEYLLNTEQCKLFATHYQQVHPILDLSQTRKAYRLLLFMMNVLGEKDLNIWMQATSNF